MEPETWQGTDQALTSVAVIDLDAFRKHEKAQATFTSEWVLRILHTDATQESVSKAKRAVEKLRATHSKLLKNVRCNPKAFKDFTESRFVLPLPPPRQPSVPLPPQNLQPEMICNTAAHHDLLNQNVIPRDLVKELQEKLSFIEAEHDKTEKKLNLLNSEID